MRAPFCKKYCIACTYGVLSWLNSVAQSIKRKSGYDTSVSFTGAKPLLCQKQDFCNKVVQNYFFFTVLHQGSLIPGATTPLREQVLLLLQNLFGSRSPRCLKAAARSVAANSWVSLGQGLPCWALDMQTWRNSPCMKTFQSQQRIDTKGKRLNSISEITPQWSRD